MEPVIAFLPLWSAVMSYLTKRLREVELAAMQAVAWLRQVQKNHSEK